MDLVDVSVLFYQDNSRHGIPLGGKLRGPVTELLLKLWSTLELLQWYHVATSMGVKTFNLKQPINVDVEIEGRQYHFVCERVPAAKISHLRPDEKPFRLKKTVFIIRSKSEFGKWPNSEQAAQPSTANLDAILNRVERDMIKAVKPFCPIIYTGMTS